MASNIENNELAKAYKGKDLAPDLNIQVSFPYSFNAYAHIFITVVEFHALKSDNC